MANVPVAINGTWLKISYINGVVHTGKVDAHQKCLCNFNSDDEKSVNVLDKTKQLWCVFFIAGCRRKRTSNGVDPTHLAVPLPVTTVGLSACSDGSRSHITANLVCCASFNVHSYHSIPFAAEWNFRKTSIVSFTLDWKPHVCAVDGTMNGGHGPLKGTTY
ncbi:hypothetical protein TNCV_1242801 [Trichonephila clavipes]|nr:hypothetical protein TNCV_1242801 [Trichonephila clavipes]